MSSKDLKRNVIQGLGGGVAVAENLTDMRMPSKSDPAIPDAGIPNEPAAVDVEIFARTNKLRFLGQDESDPSMVVFEDEKKQRCKYPQAMFHSGFRGTNQAKE